MGQLTPGEKYKNLFFKFLTTTHRVLCKPAAEPRNTGDRDTAALLRQQYSFYNYYQNDFV